MNQRLSLQHGLTLLELLITLAIFSLLTGMALPSFDRSIKRISYTTTANQMIGLVYYARAEAVNSNNTVTLCGSSDGLKCNGSWSNTILVFSDVNDSGQIDSDEKLLRKIATGKNGTLTWRSFRNKPYLQLHPSGLTYYQNGNFTFCPLDGDEHYALHWILSVNGLLRLATDKNHDGILDKADGSNIEC